MGVDVTFALHGLGTVAMEGDRRSDTDWDAPVGVLRWQTLKGRIAVMVGADGSVQSARMVESVHPSHNSLLIAAARRWRFEPATRNGEPIPYDLEIEVVLDAARAKR